MTGGVESVMVWDLRKLKPLHNFTELHCDDVTSVRFSQKQSNLILTASEDYLINLLDTNESTLEDEYLEASYTCEQPISKCDFIADTGFAYIITNVNTIEILDLETMLVKSVFDPKKQSDGVTNIIGAQAIKDDVLFYMGDFKGGMYVYNSKFELQETILTDFKPFITDPRDNSVVSDAFKTENDNFVVCTDKGEVQQYQKVDPTKMKFDLPQDVGLGEANYEDQEGTFLTK